MRPRKAPLHPFIGLAGSTRCALQKNTDRQLLLGTTHCLVRRFKGRVRCWVLACLGEHTLQEPLSVVDAVAVVAVDPHCLAARIFGDEIIAAHVGAIPPA